jgi:Sec-independent protein secretion pathway component TatC
MAIPMYLLYEGGILMARVLSRMRREAQEREEANASSSGH